MKLIMLKSSVHIKFDETSFRINKYNKNLIRSQTKFNIYHYHVKIADILVRS